MEHMWVSHTHSLSRPQAVMLRHVLAPPGPCCAVETPSMLERPGLHACAYQAALSPGGTEQPIHNGLSCAQVPLQRFPGLHPLIPAQRGQRSLPVRGPPHSAQLRPQLERG